MLTSKQEAFCQAVSGGLSQSDAYKSAYKTAAMKAETITNSAYKLMQNGEVTARLAELRVELAERGLWSREDSLKTLIGVIKNPDNAGNIIASVAAINKMQGYDAPTETKTTGTFNVNVRINGC